MTEAAIYTGFTRDLYVSLGVPVNNTDRDITVFIDAEVR